MQPLPAAIQALSTPPAATAQCSGSPNSRATLGNIVPIKQLDSFNGGKSSFLVVNNSTRESGAANLSFTLPIKANVYNKESTITADGKSLTLSLGPGECSLVEITNYR